MLERGAHASVFEIAWSFRVGDDGETASPVTRFRMNRSSLGNPATVTELTEARVPVARSGRERVRGWGGATCRVQHRRRYLVARADQARWPARSSKPVGGVTSLAGGFDSHAPSPAYGQAKSLVPFVRLSAHHPCRRGVAVGYKWGKSGVRQRKLGYSSLTCKPQHPRRRHGQRGGGCMIGYT
jgi:hypothetical protein